MKNFISKISIRLADSIIASTLKLREENRGYHDQQSDNSILAMMDDKVVGFLDYSKLEDEIYVQMISVEPEYRRQGIATEMLKKLDSLYPDTEFEPGMSTDEGAQLLQEYLRRYPKKLNVENGMSNKEFVMSLSPVDGKYKNKCKWSNNVNFAYANAGIDMNNYQFDWQPDMKRFKADVKKITDNNYKEIAKALRKHLGIKKNIEVKYL